MKIFSISYKIFTNMKCGEIVGTPEENVKIRNKKKFHLINMHLF